MNVGTISIMMEQWFITHILMNIMLILVAHGSVNY